MGNRLLLQVIYKKETVVKQHAHRKIVDLSCCDRCSLAGNFGSSADYQEEHDCYGEDCCGYS